MIIPHKLRNKIKPLAERAGLGGFLRQAYVEALLSGERLKFALVGRPPPSHAILLAGSGRSGTTWLGELLSNLPGIQPIFEPLFPPWNEMVRRLTGWDCRDPYWRLFYLPAEADHPAWAALWRRILTGRWRNYWTDYERTHFFPDRFLIKEVRAGLMLGFVWRCFQPRLIYLLRHPAAVVHSRLSAPIPWQAHVQDILGQYRLVQDHLQGWEGEIEKETDLIGAHAVWWAVEARVALRQLESVPHYRLFYEDLLLQPRQTLAALIAWLGYDRLPPRLEARLARPSRMSNERLRYADALDRLSRWQRDLPAAAQRRILGWARRLGLEFYDETPLPRRRSEAHVP